MNSESGQERRHGTRGLIQRLLEGRQEMWVLYERLAGVDPYSEQDLGQLKNFTQLLVDYIAAGHFGLYQRIDDRQERRKGVIALAEELYPQIVSSTDVAVAFNDKYERKSVAHIDAELVGDLSELGEHLALRTDLEDRLIAEMMK